MQSLPPGSVWIHTPPRPMTDPQTNRLAMHQTVLGVLDAHADAWAHVPALQAYRDALAALVERVRAAARQQATPSRTATAPKEELRDGVRAAAGRLAGAVAAWARSTGKPEVAAAVDLPKRELARLRDAALAEYSEIVVAEARRHLPARDADPTTGLGHHGVTAADVDALDQLDDAFARALSTPREAIIAASQGTAEIAVAQAEASALLDKEVDPHRRLSRARRAGLRPGLP